MLRIEAFDSPYRRQLLTRQHLDWVDLLMAVNLTETGRCLKAEGIVGLRGEPMQVM